MALEPKNDPSNPSADYTAMAPDWQMIADIRAGARRVKEKGELYLPRYENEAVKAYKKRLEATPWRPEFVDALRNLCSKPFTKAVALQGAVPAPIKEIAEDIDGEGNDLHSFARSQFVEGVAAGVVGIYVTYPDAEPAKTVAEEKKAGTRPYWVPLLAENILALYTVKVNGRDLVQHIRLRECHVERDGYAEKETERVRVIDIAAPGTAPAWELFEKQIDPTTKDVTWVSVGRGTITLDLIPIVLFFTGERSGIYRVKPPLIDLAVMQMEIYRALSREDEILTFAGSPMLKAKGMNPPAPSTAPIIVDGRERLVETPAPQVTVGPKTVLFAPPGAEGVQPDWDFIQPDAANITAVSENVDNKIEHFRHLALQPATRKSGNLVATVSAIDAAKAHSAVEVWANGLKDVLEQAFVFTCMWLKLAATVEVSVHTDFGIDAGGGDETKNLLDARKNGDLSQRTLWEEMQRRGTLGPQFDPEVEEQRLLEEVPGDDSQEDIESATTPPRKPANAA